MSIVYNPLPSVTVQLLRNFLRARLARVGFRTIQALIDASDLSRGPVFSVFTANDAKELKDTRTDTLELIAAKLQFKSWGALLDAWRADDVMNGLEGDAIEPAKPDPLIAPLLEMTIDQRLKLLHKAWPLLSDADRNRIIRDVREGK